MEATKAKKVTFIITPEAEAVLARHKEFGYALKQDFMNAVLSYYGQMHGDDEVVFTSKQERRLQVLIRQILEKDGYKASFR